MRSIAILITSHNRKLKTLKCLSNLYEQEGIFTEFNLDVFLVDDASTDGTAEAIRNQFPEVNIITGDGTLFWNRGMHLAWATAASLKEYDYYLWLNDDTFLFKYALNSLLKCTLNDAIVCGTTKSKFSRHVTYGAYFNRKLIIPNGNTQIANCFNGNCVLVPKDVYNTLGNLDPIFQHALGDFDYALRAVKAGVHIFVCPVYTATCESHSDVPNWRSKKYSLLKRIGYLYHPLSGCNTIEYFKYDYRHNGKFTAILHFFTIHLRAILPDFWSLKYLFI